MSGTDLGQYLNNLRGTFFDGEASRKLLNNALSEKDAAPVNALLGHISRHLSESGGQNKVAEGLIISGLVVGLLLLAYCRLRSGSVPGMAPTRAPNDDDRSCLAQSCCP